MRPLLALSAIVAISLTGCGAEPDPNAAPPVGQTAGDGRYDNDPAEGRGEDGGTTDISSSLSGLQDGQPEIRREILDELNNSIEEDLNGIGYLDGEYDAEPELVPVIPQEFREQAQRQAAASRSRGPTGRASSSLGASSGSSAATAKPGVDGAVYSYDLPTRAPADPPPPPPVEEPSTEDYTDYGLNAMTLASNDALSTFSIDVDTASYTIARKKLLENRLPPTDSVRVEEFVNYFDYDYAQPQGEAPFAVDMEAAPHPYQSSHHVLRVGVQGREVEDSARKPMHLVFLVDVSGSMSAPDKLPLIKRSLKDLVNRLGPEDTVALATYAGNTRKVLDPTVATQRSVIHAAIDDLNASGSTAMSSGIEIAYSMASESMVYGAENRVIVCSDGDANVGGTSHEQILRTIQHYAEEGITLSTIGFGMGNYKDTMMEQLANKGDGNYFYIDDYQESQKVFGEDLTSTLQVIAKDVKIQVEFNPQAVYAYRLIGYENRDIADRDFRNDRVDAGEVGAGHSVTALYDVVLKDDWRQHEIATVRLRNKKPGPDSPAVEWVTTFPASMVHAEFASASRDYRLAFGAATFAELLRGSHYTAEVTYAQVWNMVNRARRTGDTHDAELLDLIRRAGDLSGEQLTAQR